MKAIYHPELAAGRWFTLSLTEQLGNVGSEFERVLRWKEEENAEHFHCAFARMLELLDLTIADPRWQNHSRQRKLVRLKEQIYFKSFLSTNAKDTQFTTVFFQGCTYGPKNTMSEAQPSNGKKFSHS